MTESRFTTNAHVAAMLDGVKTLPCAFCLERCPVPENVLAVVQRNGGHHPIAVCDTCSDTLLVVLPMFAEGLAHAKGER